MKNILYLTLTITAAVLIASCDSGSMFDPNTRTVKADTVMRVEATGDDLRVYEFTPQTAPHLTCIFIAGYRKGGLVCVPRK